MNPDQQLGDLLARVRSLEQLEERIDDKLTTLQGTVSDIQLTLAGAKGSWRALVLVGAALAAISGAAGALAHAFVGRS
jgi:hypothetical protein